MKLAVTLQPVLASLGAATAGTGAIDSLDAEIDLPHPLSKKLLARHLKVALPQFIESAQIAANGMLGGPRDRKKMPKEKAKISIISVNFESKRSDEEKDKAAIYGRSGQRFHRLLSKSPKFSC